MRDGSKKLHLIKDVAILALSIAFAIILAKNGFWESIITTYQELRFIGSFVVGMFFTSILTTAPAIIMLAELSQKFPLLEVAFFGGLGAVVGDLIIFLFIRESVMEDISYLLKKSKLERLGHIFRLKTFRRLIFLLGGLVLASPLPDELGLAMMGLSKTRTLIFIPTAFIFNFLGIMAIGIIARFFN